MNQVDKLKVEQNSYRSIMKATSLFGGVQLFQIIIQIIRSKFVAILLGPAGMGIVGLLQSTLGLIAGLTNFGIGVSAVKNIAEANNTKNGLKIAKVVIVMRRLVWVTGIFGTIISFILSPWLSQLTFGNDDYSIIFFWVSLTLLINQLCSGQLVLLQGMRKLQYLAKAELFGSVLGLIISIPLYYKFGKEGIAPVIISTSVLTMAVSWFYSRKVIIADIKVDTTETIIEAKKMISLGFMISLGGLISVGVSYIVRLFIIRTGTIEDVGLYNAGFTIINTYVGLIFTAMATDYFPRLSAVSYSNLLSKQIINQQAEVALLILAPILIIFLVFIKWIVVLLYSTEFLAISGMIYWAALGMFFKTVSWAIAFLFLSKNASKLYFLSELTINLFILLSNLIGYHYWGLSGLGISFMIGYIFYLFQVYIIAKIKYQFSFDSTFQKIFIKQLILILSSFTIMFFSHKPYNYFFGLILILISATYSISELNKKINLNDLLNSFKKSRDSTIL